MLRLPETASRIAAIVAVVLIVYGPTLAFDFTYLDDDKLILQDQEFLRHPGNVARAFGRDVFGKATPAYRPGLTLSLMVDSWIGGPRPLGYHATNVVIHALASVAVFLALVALGYPRRPSGGAALVVAVHPLLTPAVAWVPGRNDALLALFVLIAWIAFLRGVTTGSRAASVLAVVAFAAALFTKETALAFPALALLYLALLARERLWSRRAGALVAGWLAVALVWWLLREAALAGSTPVTLSWGTLLANARTIPDLLGGIVLPFSRPVLPTFSLRHLAAGVVVALVIAAAALLVERDRRRAVLFGVAWFVGFLAPTLAWRDPQAEFDYLDHRAWLPLVGIAMVALEMVRRLQPRIGASALAWGTAAMVVVLGGLAGWHARQFRDGLTFWTAAVNAAPASPEAHHTLGYVRHSRGDLEGAKLAYLSAIDIQPSNPAATPKYHINLGRIYEAQGQRPRALREYERALEISPTFAAAHLNIGTIRFQEGRLVDAETAFLQALALDPDLSLAHSNMCGVRLMQRRLDVAERFCLRALELQPDLLRARIALALVHHGQGRWQDAGVLVDDLRARGVAVERVLPDVVAALRARRR